MPNSTPGQIAYAAFYQRRYQDDPHGFACVPPFAAIPPATRAAWEAAAQAVRVAHTAEILAHAARAQEDPP